MALSILKPSLFSTVLRFFFRHDSTTSLEHLQHITPNYVVKPESIPWAVYGGRHIVTMIPGSGIGPELMSHVMKIFKVANAPVDFQIVEVDAEKHDNVELEYAITAIKRNGIAIKGNVATTSKSIEVKVRNTAIRNALNLFACVMHCKTYPGVPSKYEKIDIVVIRQNTEGEYRMLEHMIPNTVRGKVVESLKIITKENSLNIAEFAFNYAKKHNRKKVTTVHKANIMKLSDGLFLKTSQEVAKRYPEIQHSDLIVDNTCMQLVANPSQFDVLLTPNLYGNVVANVICGLTGGPFLVAQKNYGERSAIFEPATRVRATRLVGKDEANPVGMIMAGVDILDHLGHKDVAKLIRDGVFHTICEKKVHTKDLGGSASTSDVVAAIVEYVKSKLEF